MKLIDANKEIAFLRDWQKELDKDSNREYNLLEMIIHGIENEPAAYDLDEVIKQVQEITERIFNYCEEIDNNIPENERSGYRLLPDIFMLRDVVKNGGLYIGE